MRSVVLIVALLAATSLAVPRRVYEPDDVLPEHSSLLQTQAKVHAGVVHPTIKKELKKIKQVAEGSQKGAVKNLEYLMQEAADADAKAKTPTDGGTQQIATSVTTAKTAITSAINSMKTSLTNDHATAQTDLNTLEAAIDQTKNVIATADLEAIKVKAHQWCTSDAAHATAVTDYSTASTNFDAVKNPVIPSAQAFLKNIHPINDCNSGNVAQTDTCPAWTCTLESTLSNAVTSARSKYHEESWDFQEATNAKTTAKSTNDAKQSAYTSAVSTLLLAQTSTCTASHGIWTSAKTSFDANNEKRAWMYHSLLKIECYVTHLDGTNTQQSALDTCLSNVNTVGAIKTARFPAATGSGQTYTCPTQTDYINDLKAYGEPDLNLDGTWTPAVTGSCAAITAQGGATSQAPASTTWILFGDIDNTKTCFTNQQTVVAPGVQNGDSLQIGTFDYGTPGQTCYSKNINKHQSSSSNNFDLKIEYGSTNVYTKSIAGFDKTNGYYINNENTAEGVVNGQHGMYGSRSQGEVDGYWATYCAYNGGCGDSGQDFWQFSTNGVYPDAAGSVPCGFYYPGNWANCPSGDNVHRMRYYYRDA